MHYLLKFQPEKRVRIAELQVRTIFEEGWSEIDHRVRYPRRSNDPYLAELLTIFNRLAGSADEMGTFTAVLAAYIEQQAERQLQQEEVIARNEQALKDAISRLQIHESEKKQLQAQITELRKSSLSAISAMPEVGSTYYPKSLGELLGVHGGASGFIGRQKSRCITCFKEFEPGALGYALTCSECRSKSSVRFLLSQPE